MTGFSSNILAITDRESLGAAVQRLLRAKLGNAVAVSAFTYFESLTFLTPERVADTDLFVLELFRHYQGGLRAEGMVLAQRLVRRGKRTLVISPLSLGRQKNCRGYWDVASSDTLAERLQELILSGHLTPQSEWDYLRRCFSSFLDLPPQHK